MRAEPLIKAVLSERISVREGVEEMFHLLPSSLYDEVVGFAQTNTIIRPGFAQFIHTCGQLGWKVAVVSGGFDFFVQPVIHKLSTPVDIYCNTIHLDGPMMEVHWGVLCDDECEGGCGLCKPSVMRRLASGGPYVVIGDGVTDFKAAKIADFVFARWKLLEIVREQAIPSSPFDTFYDIEREMKDGGSPLYEAIR